MPRGVRVPGNAVVVGGISTHGLQVRQADPEATIGRAALGAGGVVDVFAPAVDAQTLILLTVQQPAGTPGFVGVAQRTAGVGFRISSSNAGDRSVVGWLLVDAGPPA